MDLIKFEVNEIADVKTEHEVKKDTQICYEISDVKDCCFITHFSQFLFFLN